MCMFDDLPFPLRPVLKIVISDLNPAFGQGLSKILIEITVLNSTLLTLAPPSSPSIPSSLSVSFLKRAKQLTQSMYDLNRMLDYGYDTTSPQEGESLLLGEAFRNHWVKLLRLCEQVRVMTFNAHTLR
jgi:hypothetical protein